MLSLIIGCSLLFKPLAPPTPAARRTQLFNRDIWKRRKYVIWALAIPTALFGYFVPYVHMVRSSYCILLSLERRLIEHDG